MATEADIRLNILNTLLTTPHRKIDGLYPTHQALIQQDPLFYVRLAAWHSNPSNGQVRDHNEVFAASLCLSNFDGHRDVGLALLRELPPYQVGRVVDFISGKKTTKKAKVNKAVKVAAGVDLDLRKEIQPKVESFGLFKPIPRSMRTEVERFLREREADADWFDSTVLIARNAMKRLYALLHVKPSPRADAILFKNAPPEDSKLHALKALASAKTPAEQAAKIIDLKIPYRVATTVVTAMTPTVLLALIEVMSPQDLINNMGSLKRRGAFDNPELKTAIEAKLEKAKKGKRVAAGKVAEAIKIAGVSQDVVEKLEKVADAQMKAKGRLTKPTVIMCDKSGSMSSAISVAKQVGAMLSSVADAALFCYAFDSMPYPILPQGTDMAAWDKAFHGVTAHGGTYPGVVFDAMIRARQVVQSVLLVSDGGESSSTFAPGYRKYVAAMGVEPNVCMVHVKGDTNTLVPNCKAAGIDVDVFEYTGGDVYSLPGLIPMVTKSGKLDLLMSIMETELPKRRAA